MFGVEDIQRDLVFDTCRRIALFLLDYDRIILTCKVAGPAGGAGYAYPPGARLFPYLQFSSVQFLFRSLHCIC